MQLDMTDTIEDEAPVPSTPSLLARLSMQPADALLALIGAHRMDPRLSKIDLGVGVYRDDTGATPVFQAVKEAERRLVETQSSKGYLGPEGDIGYFDLLGAVLTGGRGFDGRMRGLQTPGGTGALRLAMELIAVANPDARVLIGMPTWPNHPPIIAAARLATVTYDYFDVDTQTVRFDAMTEALATARSGDVVLLHGCCHNPTGADLDAGQWAEVARIIAERGLVPLIDLAYQGLGEGLDADARGTRLVLEQAEEALVAYSCDKNFGLYRERTGALFTLSANANNAAVTQSNLLSLARANWSMPPDHGAAIVRTILEDDRLTHAWRTELDTMCARIGATRAALAALDPFLAPLARQHGLFSMLPLSPAEIAALREEHGVYMTGSGRINVAGLTAPQIPQFVAALKACRR